jgi:hypothetical protein
VKRILLLAAIIPLTGCPYEAAVEPVGPLLPLRSALVGTWACGTDDKPDWATLRLGWSDDRYLLILRPLKPQEANLTSRRGSWPRVLDRSVVMRSGACGRTSHRQRSASCASRPRRRIFSSLVLWAMVKT